MNMIKTADRKRAELASLSRVAACLINEKLVDAAQTDNSTFTITAHPRYRSSSQSQSHEIVIAHLYKPALFPDTLDPTEISADVFWYSNNDSKCDKDAKVKVNDGTALLRIFGKWANIDVEKQCIELENTVENQERAYKSVPPRFESPAIEWEQSIVEGISTHPWHKCRYPLVDDFKLAKLHFVAISKGEIKVVGEYERWINQLVVSDGSTDDLRNMRDGAEYVILPVHEYQLPFVQKKFPNIRVLPQTILGRPQSSLRTISVSAPRSDFCIKIPLNIKVTSVIRTIKASDVTVGYNLEPLLRTFEKAADAFGGSLIFLYEHAAAASSSEHLGCIIRESIESVEARTGDRVIVCAALADHVDSIWDHEQAEVILRQYCQQVFRGLLPSIFCHGFVMQAHQQNLLLRIHPVTREIRGIVVRDLGTYKIHLDTFTKSSSFQIEPLLEPGRCETIERLYERQLILLHSDVAPIIRAFKMGMAGWRIAREELERVIPRDNAVARKIWLETPTFPTKSFLSMQLFGFENGIPTPFKISPNLFYYCQLKDL